MTDTQQLPPYPAGPRPSHPGMWAQPSRPPRRAAFAASVVTASLLVGGAAGVGGAAAWDATRPDSAAATSSNGVESSPVSTAPDTPAAAGSVEQVAAEALPSVVKIDVSGSQGSGSGSGIILTSDGRILTNNHVAEVAENGGSLTVSFNDGSQADARIVGTDPLTDTAVIQAEDVSGLTPATIGRSANLDVGEEVVAVGSPFGLDATVTSGIVSAIDRPVNVGSDGNGNTTTYPAIQTDAAINPGNSGGPLLNLSGEVVGMNSSIRTTGATSGESGSIGLGFAIPIDEIMPIVDELAAGKTATHARLGVTVPNETSETDTHGVELQSVEGGSTADEAGLQAGDVVTKVDDHLITGADSLIATIRSYRPGDEVTVHWTRDGEDHSATLTLDSDA